MAGKKFTGPVAGQDIAALAADYEQADRFDRVRVGALGAYYRVGFRVKAIPYARMERAFIRVQQVRGRMCCGEATFVYFRLVFLVDGREICDNMSEDEKAMDAALAKIHERAPQVPVGLEKKPEQADAADGREL
ncbi:MAG: hypothetical protein IK095_06650 [Oscillospiraceae bacterium]|nr:hypothetical protein [Oscillospiraceae bacterium]